MIISDSVLKGSPLAEGGEGIIYEYNNQILKIYKDTVNKKEKLEKIQRLMNKNLPKNIIKPLEIIYNNRNQFLGYSMQRIEGEEFKRLSNKKFLKVNNISTKDILKMLVDVKNTLIELHKQNIYISDLNDGNILFDKNYNVYFIDVDSWTIDNYKCPVCMDSFKDPLLIDNNFSANTDSYAFSILCFKSLTKLHPFGGTTNPDIDILTRMSKRLSVIDNNSVTIPKTIPKWVYISPKVLSELKEIFETNNRFLLNQSLDDFYNNLKYCDKHKEYYYGKYNECPICNDAAKVVVAPVKINNVNGIPYITLVFGDDIKTILDKDIYLNDNNYIIHKPSNNKVKYDFGLRYYFSDNGDIIYKVSDRDIEINYGKSIKVDKINKSNVIIQNNKVYFISNSNNLVEMTVSQQGNYSKNITKVSFNNLFEIYDTDNYFVCNMYDNMKIINVSGYNYTLMNGEQIVNYGIHFDVVTKLWLFITENSKGKFNTYVFDKNKLIYQSDSIKFSGSLGNLCFNNNVVFKAGDGVIKGFSYTKNVYKDFICDIVNEDSKLLKEGNKFIVINEKEVYQVG
jgi:serine/threonine protein kinase